jgi:alpha-L-rhamnosidase
LRQKAVSAGNQGNQTTLFIANGDAVETYTPSFSYYGFRYASISGLPAGYTPDKETLTALRINTRVEQTSKLRFNASVDVLNKIQNAVLYTQMSNIHSHPEDCPQVLTCVGFALPAFPL